MLTGFVLMWLDARDFRRDPPTDTADVVATAAALVGSALWLLLR